MGEVDGVDRGEREYVTIILAHSYGQKVHVGRAGYRAAGLHQHL